MMCDNCIHKPVCGKFRATGGVKKCEHFKEEATSELKVVLNRVDLSDEELRQMRNAMRNGMILPGGDVPSIELLEPDPKWIPVTERLPEEWHRVLVFIPSIDAMVIAKLRGGLWYSSWDSIRLDNVSC